MTNNYTLFLLNNELTRLLDARDVLNSVGDSSEAVNTKIKNIENSIKTLESNRGLIVTESEGGKMIINENGLTFTGKLTVTTSVDMDKYKWDSVRENLKLYEIITNQYEKLTALEKKSKTNQDYRNDLIDALTSIKVIEKEFEKAIKDLAKKHKEEEKNIILNINVDNTDKFDAQNLSELLAKKLRGVK